MVPTLAPSLLEALEAPEVEDEDGLLTGVPRVVLVNSFTISGIPFTINTRKHLGAPYDSRETPSLFRQYHGRFHSIRKTGFYTQGNHDGSQPCFTILGPDEGDQTTTTSTICSCRGDDPIFTINFKSAFTNRRPSVSLPVSR